MKKKNTTGTRAYSQWTLKEMESLVRMWDTSDVASIGESVGKTKQQVFVMAKALRDNGILLPKKRIKGNRHALVAEFVRRYGKKYSK